MARYRVAVLGSVGKSIWVDDALPSRVAALEDAVSAAGSAAGARHSSLRGLQVGDDHPQYAMWQAAEQVVGQWNFATEPDIQGVSLTEFIQDTVGLDLVDDTASVTWTYDDPGGTLKANVVTSWSPVWTGNHDFSPASGTTTFRGVSGGYAQTVIGFNSAGNSRGVLIQAGLNSSDRPLQVETATGATSLLTLQGNGFLLLPNDLQELRLGATAPLRLYHTGTVATFRASSAIEIFTSTADTLGFGSNGISRLLIGTTGNVRFPQDNQEVQVGVGSGGNGDLRMVHDGTNSIVRNDTGELRFQAGTTVVAALESAGALDMRQQVQRSNAITPAALAANTDNYAPTGLSTCSVIRLSASGAFNLTGIAAQPGGTCIRLLNIGTTDTVTLVHDATSTAANRFLCPNSTNVLLRPNGYVDIWYDSTSSRWRVAGA